MRVATLNPAQQDAVTATGSILVCACPGSGKTHVLVEKVLHVLTTRPKAQIIMTTFSRDAALGMAERVRNRLKKMQREHQINQVLTGTFHALAMRQLKAAGMNARVLVGIEALHLIHRALEITKVGIAPEDAEAAIYACKVDPAYRKANPVDAVLTSSYQKELRTRGVCDFADLLLLANSGMSKGTLKPLPATDVFADEMQDIDAVQYTWLMHHLAGGREACAVGDDDQSIYAFRASLGYRGMMRFQADTGARIITLDTNYRSTSGIVEAAATLIKNNTDRVPKRLLAARGAGERPQVLKVAEGEPQALAIIEILDRVCAKNEIPESKRSEPYRFGVKRGQVAVLARTNRQLELVELVFNRHRVPYLRMGSSFWDKESAQVFMALLLALANRESTGIEVALRWARVPDSVIRALGESHEGNLAKLLAGSSKPAVQYSHELKDFLHFGRQWIHRLNRDQSDEAINFVIDGVQGWMKAVLSESCGTEELGLGGQRGGRRLRLRDVWVVDAVHEVLLGLSGPVVQRLRRAKMEGEQHVARVVLSTFHASKGLEWDHVFLIDVAMGMVPNVGDDATNAEIEEERRVFYVAMTRARDALVLCTREDPRLVSEFLLEANLLQAAQQERAAA